MKMTGTPKRTRYERVFRWATLAVCAGLILPPTAWAQSRTPPSAMPSAASGTLEQPDAQRIRDELGRLMEHYPPALRGVLALDPALLGNQSYLAAYPSLVSFLAAHPEIARNPSFYFGEGDTPRDHAERIMDMWREVLAGFAVFCGFGMAISLVVWLIKTLVDYRRWNRLTKIQTDIHTKLLDRFTANDDMLQYIQSPAGSKFLQSSPILLDAAPRSMGAPLARILWSVQGGVVLMAAGIGLQVVSTQVVDDASQPLHVLGVLAIALGLGFVISAIISFVISHRLGLIEPASTRVGQESGTRE